MYCQKQHVNQRQQRQTAIDDSSAHGQTTDDRTSGKHRGHSSTAESESGRKQRPERRRKQNPDVDHVREEFDVEYVEVSLLVARKMSTTTAEISQNLSH